MITGMEMGEAEKPDPNRPSLVLYAKGYGEESGRYVKAYMNPSAEMINNMKLVAPGKVFSYEI